MELAGDRYAHQSAIKQLVEYHRMAPNNGCLKAQLEIHHRHHHCHHRHTIVVIVNGRDLYRQKRQHNNGQPATKWVIFWIGCCCCERLWGVGETRFRRTRTLADAILPARCLMFLQSTLVDITSQPNANSAAYFSKTLNFLFLMLANNAKEKETNKNAI